MKRVGVIRAGIGTACGPALLSILLGFLFGRLLFLFLFPVLLGCLLLRLGRRSRLLKHILDRFLPGTADLVSHFLIKVIENLVSKIKDPFVFYLELPGLRLIELHRPEIYRLQRVDAILRKNCI